MTGINSILQSYDFQRQDISNSKVNKYDLAVHQSSIRLRHEDLIRHPTDIVSTLQISIPKVDKALSDEGTPIVVPYVT